MTKQVEINRELAIKVLSVVDKGLCKGLGQPEEGKMCVEAAVNYAMGLPHGDEPACVSRAVRTLKIKLNDKNWSSNDARAKGMRRLAIAQLGTSGQINDIEFIKAVAQMTIAKIVPRAFRSAARIAGKVMKPLLEEWAEKIEKEPTEKLCRLAVKIIRKKNAAAAAAYAAAYAAAEAADAAAADAARDKEMAFFAEEVVQILITMNAPGAEWLNLTVAA